MHLIVEEHFPFMVCCMLFAIRTRTNIQLDHLIFLFFCCLFSIYPMIFVYMDIVKEIVFACVIYAATIYHNNKRNIHYFTLLEPYCDLGGSILIWFQVLGQIVIHIFPV